MSLLAKNVRSLPPPDESGPATSGVNALLGQGSSFEGKLTFEGTVHINGTFVGDIRSKDTLVIGEGGRVQGDVQVGTLIINGHVEGQIRATQLVELKAPARVRGTLSTPTLVIERGATFDGTSHMETRSADKPAPESKADKK